jgi:starch synthase
MKILFTAAEAAPLVKVGGLADVVGSLPKALAQLGEDARVILPKYGVIDENRFPSATIVDSFTVEVMRRKEQARLKQTTLDGKIPVYLIENARYYGRASVYTDNEDLERYLFFSRAVIEALKFLEWHPDVIHCHDWHSSLIPMWVKKIGMPVATIFTIHNLAYQGPFDYRFLSASGLGEAWSDWPRAKPESDMTMMSQGILNADIVSTVSETYAREILTKEYGEGMEPILRRRQDDLIGIVNGIDTEEFNPERDPYLPAHYSASNPEDKAKSKEALQQAAKFSQNREIPIVGMVSRLDEQKGFDLLEKAAANILEALNIRLIILGRGREKYHAFVSQLAARYPDRVAAFIEFNNPLAHLIYAGSDIFLMPSRFEPCGLGQLIAMRYGTVPLVRHTGGLVDTVLPLSPDIREGNGFVFKEYEPAALIKTFQIAVGAYQKESKAWKNVVRRIMSLDFSWRASAQKYQSLYRKVVEKRRALP